MCKCIFAQIYKFTTTLAAFKSKTGRVAQPIADAADVTGLGFATRPLTSSYNNNYYYVTLRVKLIVLIYRKRNCAENYAKFCLETRHICETALCQPNVSIRHSFVPDMVRCLLSGLRF